MKTFYENRISLLEQEKRDLEYQLKTWKQKAETLAKNLQTSSKDLNESKNPTTLSLTESKSTGSLKTTNLHTDENAAAQFSQRMQRDKRFKAASENINPVAKISGKEENVAPIERSPTRNPLQVVKDDGNSPLRCPLQSPLPPSIFSETKNKFTSLPSDENGSANKKLSAPPSNTKSNIPGSTIISRLRSRFARA